MFRCVPIIILLGGISVAAPLTITPSSQTAKPGDLLILTASEVVNWSTSAGVLGSIQGTRIVLEVPQNGGDVTVTATDPKDDTRKSFALIQVVGLQPTLGPTWRNRTFAAGTGNSIAVSNDGRVWVWGLQQHIAQKDGNKFYSVPTLFEGLKEIKSVASSSRETEPDRYGMSAIALAENGNVWSWSDDGFVPKIVAKSIKNISFYNCAIFKTDTDKVAGLRAEYGGHLEYFRHSSDITLMDSKPLSYIVTFSSAPQIWGINKRGQVLSGERCTDNLGLISGIESATDVSELALDNVAVLLSNGNVVRVHNNEITDLAGFEDIRSIDAARLEDGGGWGFLIMRNGEVRSFVTDSMGIPSIPKKVTELADIVDISISPTHALFLRRDGTLFATGINDYGQLGNGKTEKFDREYVQVVGLKVALPVELKR